MDHSFVANASIVLLFHITIYSIFIYLSRRIRRDHFNYTGKDLRNSIDYILHLTGIIKISVWHSLYRKMNILIKQQL